MDKEIVIKQGLVSLWKRVISSILFTTVIYLILLFFIREPIFNTNYYVNSFPHILKLSIYLIVPAISLILTTNYYFNFDNKLFKIEKSLGFVRFGKWKELPHLEYISIFKKEDFYKVNLWYYKNNHFNVYNLLDYKDAIDVGVKIADKLEIDVLDATSHHDYQWLDKSEYSKSGIIQYLK